MRPSAAELARTLIAGRVPATVQLACRPGGLTVRHATDCAGAPLLLVRDDEPLALALRGQHPPAVVLSAVDIPPGPDAPGLGRVLVGGTARPVPAAHRREAVLEYAETSADPDLFDVGAGAELFHIDVAQVRLLTAHAGPGEAVDVDDYLAADPDPLYEVEAELLADLNDHHGAQLGPYLAGRLAEAGLPGAEPRAVRLDRHGFVVAPYPGTAGRPRPALVRVPFARPVHDQADLARLLHPVLFHQHRCAEHTTAEHVTTEPASAENTRRARSHQPGEHG